MNIISHIKRFFFNNFWIGDNDPLEEPVVSYKIGSKRFNDENTNGDVFIKRRKLSSAANADTIVDIDLTESEPDLNFPHIMPRHRRSKINYSFKAEKGTSGVKNTPETIEIIDEDNDNLTKETTDSLDDGGVEIVDESSSTKKQNMVSSTCNDIEIVGEYSIHRDESSKSTNSKTSNNRNFSYRIPRYGKLDVRTLKELNNRPSINGCSLDVCDKSAPSTSSASSQWGTRSYKDINRILSLEKMKKAQDRETFLSLLKRYAHSPDVKNKSLSNSTSIVPSNKTTSSTSSQRYSTRFPSSSAERRSILVPTRQSLPSTSRDIDSSMNNKTVIDLTSEEDDETQRQEIVSNVVSSDLFRNLKTTFVGKDKNITEEDYIYNILKKYEATLQVKKTHAQKIEKQIRKQEEDLHKTLSDILERRLIIKEHELVEEVDHKPAFELAPITKAMTTLISKAMSSDKRPLVQIKDTAVKAQDIRTLEKCAWLNDEVINAYMNLIKMRAEKHPDKYPKVHCFNTFLYEQLRKKGYNSVRRWTKKIDVFGFNMLIIPIHLGNHWCLCQVQLKEKCVRYFDSMGSPNELCLKTIMEYLIDEYKDKKNDTLNPDEWKLINVPPNEIPQQQNMHDCGVFACTFAEHLARQVPFNFSQENMPYFRVKMMYEILTEELLL